jgi:hypothetical protein
MSKLIHIVDDEMLSCEDFDKEIDDYVSNDCSFKLQFQNLCEKCREREASQ